MVFGWCHFYRRHRPQVVDIPIKTDCRVDIIYRQVFIRMVWDSLTGGVSVCEARGYWLDFVKKGGGVVKIVGCLWGIV